MSTYERRCGLFHPFSLPILKIAKEGDRAFPAASTLLGRDGYPLAREQDKEVESGGQRTGHGLGRRPAEMRRVRSHQQGIANAVAFEDRVARQPRDCRRPDVSVRNIGVMATLFLMLPHQTKELIELGEMTGAG